MKNNQVCSILSIIAGIINGLGTFFIFIILAGIFLYQGIALNISLLFLFFFIFGLITTILFFVASKQMKNKETYKKGSIIALVVGIISFNIIGIIAGAIGISENSK